MAEHNLTNLLAIISKIKVRLAKEIIYATIISISCFAIFKTGEYLDNKNAFELEQNIAELDSLPQHYFLWYKLKKLKIYNKEYSVFKLEFYNTKEQIFLYNLVKNNGLYTLDFVDFRIKYFTNNAALDDCVSLYYIEDPISENDFHRSETFWKDHNMKVQELKLQLKNRKFFDIMYQKWVKDGYKRSKEAFNRLIFEPNKEGVDLQKIQDLEMRISNADISYSEMAENCIILILFLAYPIRYFGFLLNWSLKQIQTK